MTIVLNIALTLSIISFATSAAVFTPMIFVSGLAAMVALVGIWQGHIRRGVLTIFFSVGAAIVSPIVFGIEPVDRWLVVLPAIGASGAAVMYWQYRRHQIQSH